MGPVRRLRIVRFFLKAIGLLVAILVTAFLAAAVLIPANKSFTQVTEINASRETVWKVLTDRERYAEWQDQLTKIEIKNDKDWTETTKDGQILEMTFVSKNKPSDLRLSYNIGESFKGAWKGELREISTDKTIIRTTDSTEINSVVMKIMVAIFFDIEDFAKGWNQKLKKRAEALQRDNGNLNIDDFEFIPEH